MSWCIGPPPSKWEEIESKKVSKIGQEVYVWAGAAQALGPLLASLELPLPLLLSQERVPEPSCPASSTLSYLPSFLRKAAQEPSLAPDQSLSLLLLT